MLETVVILGLHISSTQVGQVVIGTLVGAIGVMVRRLFHKTDNIHVLVNGRLDSALQRIKVLEKALQITKGADPSTSPLT